MLSALDLARRIEAGAIKPRDAVELCAEAITAREKDVGAFAALDLDAARRAADAPGLAALPLRAMPVAFKDIFATADLPTQYGSPIYAGYRPLADATAVALTRRAGGVVIGKTVTTQFASLVPSATRNPQISRTRRAARRRAPPPRSRQALCRSPSARRPRAP